MMGQINPRRLPKLFLIMEDQISPDIREKWVCRMNADLQRQPANLNHITTTAKKLESCTLYNIVQYCTIFKAAYSSQKQTFGWDLVGLWSSGAENKHLGHGFVAAIRDGMSWMGLMKGNCSHWAIWDIARVARVFHSISLFPF